MNPDRSFRFERDVLNRRLISLLSASDIPYVVGADGRAHFQSDDDARFERVLNEVRSGVFPSWQVLSFPAEWEGRYRNALAERAVNFEEECNDGATEFLLPADATPLEWAIG